MILYSLFGSLYFCSGHAQNEAFDYVQDVDDLHGPKFKNATFDETKSLHHDRRSPMARPDCVPTSSRAFSSRQRVECRRMAFAWPANFVAMLYHASYNKDVVSRGLLQGGILVGWISLGPESVLL